jgi:hypothetical protein
MRDQAVSEYQSQHLSGGLWIPKKSESSVTSFLRNSLQWLKADPRQLELEEADRKAMVEQLRKTLARMADSILWSALAIIVLGALLAPPLGLFKGLVFSAGSVSIFWTVLGRVRRI